MSCVAWKYTVMPGSPATASFVNTYLQLTPRDAVEHFQVWQFVTYMFLHGGFGHLFFNLLVLWFIGTMVETAWGPTRFLRYYIVCGIGGGLLHALLQYNASVIGASGAIFGVYFAAAMLFPDQYVYIYFLIPVKMKHLVVCLTLLAAMLASGLSAQDWAKSKLEKSTRHGEWVKVQHDGRSVEAYIVYPEVKEKAPVVLVIHEIFGLTDWEPKVADRLVGSPLLFRRCGQRHLADGGSIERRAAAAGLEKSGRIDPGLCGPHGALAGHLRRA
jgi:hypothetical protein